MNLSTKSVNYLQSIENKRKRIDKPTWTEYFISMAQLASTRSADGQTKHGCVITDINHRVLGIGYNSFPSAMPDDILPNLRPEKYKWMIHAERNALSNCALRPKNGIAYITGPPCLDCTKSLYQEGIKKIVCVNNHSTYDTTEEDSIVLEILSAYGDIDIEMVSK
mgnify:CR=1 FL=1